MMQLFYYEELSSAEKNRFLRHIGECSRCKAANKSVSDSLDIISHSAEKTERPAENQALSDKIKIAIKSSGCRSNAERRPFMNKEFVCTLTACLLMTIVMHNFILPQRNGDASLSNGSYFLRTDSTEEVKGLKYRSIYSPKTLTDVKESEESLAIMGSIKRIAFEDGDLDVQLSAVAALARLGSPFAIESLIEIANSHTNPRIRRAAIGCLTNYLEAINISSSRLKNTI